jgi:hypothetical protein
MRTTRLDAVKHSISALAKGEKVATTPIVIRIGQPPGIHFI